MSTAFVNLSTHHINHPSVIDGKTMYRDKGKKPMVTRGFSIKALAILTVLLNSVEEDDNKTVIVDDDINHEVNVAVGRFFTVIPLSIFNETLPPTS